jgi:hypothetical protein
MEAVEKKEDRKVGLSNWNFHEAAPYAPICPSPSPCLDHVQQFCANFNTAVDKNVTVPQPIPCSIKDNLATCFTKVGIDHMLVDRAAFGLATLPSAFQLTRGLRERCR